MPGPCPVAAEQHVPRDGQVRSASNDDAVNHQEAADQLVGNHRPLGGQDEALEPAYAQELKRGEGGRAKGLVSINGGKESTRESNFKP